MFLLLLHFIFFFMLIPSSSSFSGPIAKPGCPNRCGNLSIPFPFGIGMGCSLSKDFNFTCINNTSVRIGSAQVIEIKPSQIRVTFPTLLGKACYNKSGDPLGSIDKGKSGNSLHGSPYSFSDENWLTVLGCDDLVTTFGTDDDEEEAKFGSSCVSYCWKNSSVGEGICPDNDVGYPPGNGCCVTAIPRGVSDVAITLTDLSKEWRDRKLFSCSYAFIQEKVGPNQSTFSYPLSYLNNPKEFLDTKNEIFWRWKDTRSPPVVKLDWRINNNGVKNCSHAKKNATIYACKKNSDCLDDVARAGGYRCLCKNGYEGNPYIGCKDIDECANSEPSPCVSKSICINKPGSVSCSCRKGYDGDGRKDGSGCIPSKLFNILIGVGSGFGFILLLSICFLMLKAHQRRKNKMRRQKFFKQNGGLLLKQRSNEGTIGETKLFRAEELEKATDNFNESRILGHGGQGIVYKGMLPDGKIVAIKKSKLVDKDQLDQFINELVILSQINHRNVVKLLGCCLENEVPLLVYEFLPNGTLYDLIHESRVEFPISWNMRLKFGADIAGALAYLHSSCSTPIYHRDIKSSNILLDKKYVVKVSDFGISRSHAMDRTHLTTRVKGTFGYFDPEYFQSHQFTDKSDVYSFGVVLVELLTGQKPISTEREEHEKSLVMRFLALIEDNNVDAILDPQVLEGGGKEEVSGVIFLARRCLNLQGKMRPTMKEVATELESLRLPKTIIYEAEERRIYEAKSTMVSDTEYTWTASDLSEVPSSSSDIYPLRFGTV